MTFPRVFPFRSLQLRLLLSTSLASSAILALLGVSVYLLMRHRLLEEFDAALLTKARTLAAMVELNGSEITFDADLDQMPEFSAGRQPEYFEIWLSDGKVLARSPSLKGGDLPRAATEPEPHREAVALPTGHRGLQITLLFSVRPGNDDPESTQPSAINQTGVVTVAARPFEVSQTLDDLEALLWTLCGTAVVLSGAVLVLIVRREMRPVTRLATEIGSMKETDLSRHLESDQVPVELAPVVEKLNGLLGRLDQSFSRERAFTADVAHELRTPLAGILTTLEVCRTRPRESSAYELAIDECRSMTGRLQSLIENLLLLARADAGQLLVRKQPTDLYHLMQECWLPLLDRVAAKHANVANSNSGDCTLPIDAAKMRMVLCNLLDNAVSYVPEGGSIRWCVNRIATGIAIEVTNTGSQVNADDANKLFDRFYRGDQARSDTGVHCGLGLSLCQRLMRLMGGEIRIATKIGGDFTVQLNISGT
jgi:two-component system heavy metal sensor histidine kinase CusS